MTPDLRALARQQGGAFTWAQAIELGAGRSWLTTRVSRGDLLRVLPCVYVPASAPTDERLLAHAASLWAGDDGALSHETAALRWGIGRPGPHVTVSLPQRRRCALCPTWLRVVRAKTIPAVVVDGLRVTTLSRTIADLAQVMSERDLHATVLAQLQRRAVTSEALGAALNDLGTRKGVGVLRRILKEYDPGFESLLTLELFELARRAGLDDAEIGTEIRLLNGQRVHPDIAVNRLRWDLEADGWAFHSNRSDREKDQRRDRALGHLDWKTDRFSTEAIRRDSLRTVREIGELASSRERALRQRSA